MRASRVERVTVDEASGAQYWHVWLSTFTASPGFPATAGTSFPTPTASGHGICRIGTTGSLEWCTHIPNDINAPLGMAVDPDGGVVWWGATGVNSGPYLPSPTYITADALDNTYINGKGLLLKFSTAGILEYGSYAFLGNPVSSGPIDRMPHRLVAKSIAGEDCWIFTGYIHTTLTGSFPHIGTTPVLLNSGTAAGVQIVCKPSSGPRYIRFSAGWNGATVLPQAHLLPNGLLYAAGGCIGSATLLHSRLDADPNGSADACIGCWRLSDGQVMFQSIVFNGIGADAISGFSVSDENEWIRGSVTTDSTDLPLLNSFQGYEGSGRMLYYFGLRHVFTECGVSWCQDFGTYSGTNGDDAYHAIAYPDSRFPHVMYASYRGGGAAKPTINAPSNTAPISGDKVVERLFVDQCGIPTLDWRFAAGEGHSYALQCLFYNAGCDRGDGSLTWPAGGLPNAPSATITTFTTPVLRIFQGIDSRCSSVWNDAPPLGCNKCSNLNFQPAPCLTSGPCPESGACHCGTVGTTCDLLACDSCNGGNCQCGSSACCSSTETCVGGSCVSTLVEPACPGVKKRYNLNLFGVDGANLGVALHLELCNDACFNGGMSCVTSGRLNLQPAKFPSIQKLVLNNMELVPNPNCPEQGLYTGQDGDVLQFSSVMFNCKNGNKATLGKQGRGLLFKDASFGEAIVYEENDLTNCPNKAPICYVVEVYETSARKRILIHQLYASAVIVPSAGPCPIGDPQPTCTAPVDFYECTSGPSTGGFLTCSAITSRFTFRCSDDATVSPGTGKACTTVGATFECGNLLTDGADLNYVGESLICNAGAKRMPMWGLLLSPSE